MTWNHLERRKKEKLGKEKALPHNLSRLGHKLPFADINYWFYYCLFQTIITGLPPYFGKGEFQVETL